MRDIRILYTLFFGVVAVALAYQPLFLSERGLTDFEIGLVQTAQGAAVLFVPIIVAHFADTRSSFRLTLAISFFGVAASHALLLLFHSPSSILLVMFVFSLFFSPLFTVLDSAALDALARSGTHTTYTSVRLWGSVGFLIPTVIFFPLLMQPGASMEITIWYGLGASLLSLVVVSRLRREVRVPGAGTDLPSLGAFRALLKPSLRAFSISRFLTQVSIWIWYPFFPLYLTSLGYSGAWIGIIINIGVIAEVLWATYAKDLDRISYGRVLSLVAASSVALRMLLVAASENLAVFILVQALHGPYIWAMFFRGTTYLVDHVESRYRTSFLALNGIIFQGVSRIVAGPLGGAVATYGFTSGVNGYALAIGVGGSLSALAVLVGRLVPNDDPLLVRG